MTFFYIFNKMEENIFDIFGLSDKIYSNNNNKLLEIVNDLNEVKNHSKENLIVKILEKLIIKLKIIIKENKKNTKLIRNDISKLYSELNKTNKKNDITKKPENKIERMTYNNGRYVGQFEKWSREGKGTYIFDNGDKYEGEWKNNNEEGKGIYYYNTGDVYEGEWKNNNQEGKGIYYYNSGDIYEGDFKNGLREGKGIYYYFEGDKFEGEWKNDKKEGNGIFYFKNGDREIGNYYNDKPIGNHAVLTKNGEVLIDSY